MLSNYWFQFKEGIKQVPILAIFGFIFTVVSIVYVALDIPFLPEEPWGSYIGLGLLSIGPIYLITGIVLRESVTEKESLTILEFLLVLIGVVIGIMFI